MIKRQVTTSWCLSTHQIAVTYRVLCPRNERRKQNRSAIAHFFKVTSALACYIEAWTDDGVSPGCSNVRGALPSRSAPIVRFTRVICSRSSSYTPRKPLTRWFLCCTIHTAIQTRGRSSYAPCTLSALHASRIPVLLTIVRAPGFGRSW